MSESVDFRQLAADIKVWGRELGFQQVGITDTDLSAEEPALQEWLDKGYHGTMDWFETRGMLRARPHELLPGSIRTIAVRMDYLPGDTQQIQVLKDPNKAYVSRYALGRDYHKLIRKRLAQLAKRIEAALPEELRSGPQRPFVDSAPVMERPLAAKAGLGWVGKHTLVLHSEAGSWFFLGELLTHLPLPIDESEQDNRCGDCTACLQVCPTDAFPKPYTLDARRCISYLTIENKGAIPEEFREPMGNRVFGCDDCQAICPWNKYAQPTQETDFLPRHGLADQDLVTLFNWNEEEFLRNTEGSAIRRIGYERWQRNLAVGLGNAPSDAEIVAALHKKRTDASPMVAEHIDWALAQQANPSRRRKRKIRRK
ncbi:tRNA epoxyqueuosine(34) reductase QueG [Marinimicrobium sp. ABcell2]|uniref:tRNA epoxyqueuosine(34) reductase QueG n=1 Tax=Marinimicrobium sp. ABcell2 TaxID=3069751 RepID=UPI0027B7BE04|nr:tRNA epoxyqueuosine(34) reductase QueG [Marinimicrobium sp. ABcell2]MDQ2076375.1 tRNA epoxyqueuosine(34) reductase QueG [Marinimicrobium sp. ABcell2]